jgi:hypothetical protein
MSRILSCAVLGLLLWVLAATAATKYVDGNLGADCTTGNYSIANRACNGSNGNAWNTLTEGLSNLSSGDTLSIRAGSYPSAFESTWNAIPSGGGSRATATTIQGHPGETVTITHHGGDINSGVISFGNTNQSWLTLKDFKILGTNNNSTGLRMAPAPDYMRVENVEIDDYGENGILAGGGDAQPYQWSVGMELVNLWIHDGGGRGLRHQNEGPGGEHCIYMTGVKDSILENSILEDCLDGFGLHWFGAPEEVTPRNWIIRNNIIRRAFQAGVVFQDADHPIYFYNNIVTDNLGGGQFRDNGMYVWNNTFCNNAGNWPAIWIATDTGTAFDGGVVENNIVCNNSATFGAGGIYVETGVTDAVVRNNLVYGNTLSGSGSNYVNSGTNTVESGNLVGGSFSADFVNEAGDNYRLTSTSDARNVGRNLSGETGGFSTDLLGTSRPQGSAWDIGAYEFIEGSDTTAPTTPATLTATAISSSQIDLDWPDSSDAVGVTEYRVQRSPAGCGSFVQIATVTGTPPISAYPNTGLTASTTYCYRVLAADAVPNLSGFSPNASAQTAAAADTTAPTAPGSLTATTASASEISLDWVDSFDAVGVTAYRVERSPAGCGSFVQIDTVTGSPPLSAYAATGLAASTTYCFRVLATDVVPNLSAYSNTASAATAAAGASTRGLVGSASLTGKGTLR